jgi:2,4-dienoyl-CoA reductase-like NADH-dependent reductase (Old Yellow Enzyme family)
VTGDLAFLAPGRIGKLEPRNRLVRAATSETMATADGLATDMLVALYGALAAGGAGLIITGHIFVEPDGQYEPWQTGLHDDRCIAALARVTQAVHRHGGLIFAELAHAGSQSILTHVTPCAPSVIPNAIHARAPVEMSEADIARVIAAYRAAARRAIAAGFDGIHIHSGNGYLLAEFNSPHANRRTDTWGGDAARRSRFILAVYQAIRDAVGADVPVTARLGMEDTVKPGLELEESLDRARLLADHGLDAIEPTYGVMTSYRENIRPYVGNTLGHALADGLVPQLFAGPVAEAYYRPFARALKARLAIPVILVGGLRSTGTMDDVVRSGDADFLALARPFVREPDLANKIVAGRRGLVDCVSCNICFRHEGLDPLRCWRTPKTRLLEHLYRYYWRRAGGRP